MRTVSLTGATARAIGAHGDASGDLGGGAAGGGGGSTVTDGGTAGGSGDAATTGAGGAGATDASGDLGYGAGCNTLTASAAVTIACAPDGGAPPTTTGGTIVPGTYVLAGFTDYGFCGAGTIAQTVVLTASTIETVVDSLIAGGLSHLSSTYVVSGTNIVQTQTCPATTPPPMNTFGFSVSTTAGSTTMTLVSAGGGSATVGVYIKQ
jgi:hypothetical protein